MRKRASGQSRPSAPASTDGVAAAGRSRWLISPTWDSLLFIGAPILCIVTLLPLQMVLTSQELSVLLLTFFTFGHHLPGFIRAYGDRDLFGCYRSRFLLAPPLFFAAALLFDFRDLHGLLTLISLWDIWHVLMQHYGFMRIYDAKRGHISVWTSRMDWAVSISWYTTLIVYSPHYLLGLLQRAYGVGLPIIPPDVFTALKAGLTALTGVISVAYIAYTAYLWRRGQPVALQKVVMLGVFLAATFYLYVYVEDFLVGFAVWSAFHCLQYFGIVWWFNRNRVANRGAVTSFVKFLFRPYVMLAVLYSGLILAYGGINYAINFVSQEDWRRILAAFVVTSTLLHYYYDGFIWKVRQSQTREYMDIEPAGASSQGRLSVASSRKAVKKLQPANRGGLQALYLAAVIVALGALELSRTRDDLEVNRNLVALVPQAGEAHWAVGRTWRKQGNLDEAVKEFREAARLMPSSPSIHNTLGLVLKENGQLGEAIKQYGQALSLLAGRTGRAAGSSGSPVLPKQQMESVTPAEIHSNLAVALMEKGDGDGAVQQFRLALEQSPSSGKIRTNFGWALLRLGRLDEAMEELERALAMDPTLDPARLSLGRILAEQGEKEEALRHLRAVLQSEDVRLRRAAAEDIEKLQALP